MNLTDKLTQKTTRVNNFILIGNNKLSKNLVNQLSEYGLTNSTIINHSELDCQNLRSTINKQLSINELIRNKHIKTNKNNVDTIYIGCAAHAQLQTLIELNNLCITSAKKFFPIFLHYNFAIAGPIILPGKTACFECVVHRLSLNINNFSKLTNVSKYTAQQIKETITYPATSVSLVSSAVATILFNLQQGAPKDQLNKLLEFDLCAPHINNKHVLRFPLCKTCKSFNLTNYYE